jgi:fibronectin-binding autotransporter adhesin
MRFNTAIIAAAAAVALSSQTRLFAEQVDDSTGPGTGRLVGAPSRLANTLVPLPQSPAAVVTQVAQPKVDGAFQWHGPDLGAWGFPTNWAPTGTPDGSAAAATIGEFARGGAVLVDGSFTINSLNLADSMVPTLAGIGSVALAGTLNFAGAAPSINVTNFPSDSPGTTYFGVPLGLLANDLKLNGTAGLNVNGGAIWISTPQMFSGGLNLSNTRYTNNAGDSGFGDSSNAISLNNAEVSITGSGFTNSRTFNVSGNSRLSLGDNSSTQTYVFSGNIAGNGTLTTAGDFGGNATFTTSNSFAGAINFGFGTISLFNAGAFASATSVAASGTLILQQGAASTNVDRIGNATPVKMLGGAIRMVGNSTAYNEQIGTLTLDGGSDTIVISPSSGGTTLTAGNLVRNHAAGLAIRGQNLGNSSTGTTAKVFFANGASLLRHGVIPFAYANNGNVGIFGIEDATTNLVTYGANGVQMLTGQASSLAGATTNTNVNLSSNTVDQSYTVAANTHVNTLVIAPGFDDGGNGVNGITLNGGTLLLDGGVLLSATSGVTPDNAVNTVGNIVNCPITGTNEELIIATPGRLTTNGAIHGSGGLSKIGAQNWTAVGASDYTGTTTLTGLTRFRGNILSGQPGAYGSDVSPIELYAGNANQIDPVSNLASGVNGVSFGPDAGNGTTTMSRGLNVHGNGLALLRNFTGAPFTLSGPINIDAGTNLTFQAIDIGANAQNPFVLNGAISGGGAIVMTRIAGAGLSLTLNGASSFSGGFDMSGTVIAGNDLAFGTGTISTSNDTNFSATAARTLANPLVLAAGVLTFSGSAPITFTGNVALDGTTINATASTSVTFAGNVHHGDLVKLGSGTLILSGNNDFSGILSAGNGTSGGGMIILRNNNAAGSVAGQTTAYTGSTIALDSGITTPAGEIITFDGDGVNALGGLRSLTGNNTWGGRVGAVGSLSNSIGVDAGSTLTIGAAIDTPQEGLTHALTKLGTGQLNVGSTLFLVNPTGPSNGPTFRASMWIQGPLTIAEGSVRVRPASSANGAITVVKALSIAGSPAAPSAKLDLSNTGLIIDYSGTSPLATIKQNIKAGYSNNTWTGNGITSTSAGASPSNARAALGYAEASQLNLTTFLGFPVDSTAIVVRYTFAGDSNLDGQVDVTDLGALATSWQISGEWRNGDFNYDGVIDVSDLGVLATNWQIGSTQNLGPGSLERALASFGLSNTAIPEPATLGAILCLVTPLARRARRKKRGPLNTQVIVL